MDTRKIISLDETKNRTQNRQEEREKQKEREKREKYLNSFVPRHELMALFKVVDNLKQRLYHAELLNASFERVIVNNKLANKEEINTSFSFEVNRSKAFTDVNEEECNYEARITKCLEYEIDISVTNIPDQILADKNLSLDQKTIFADNYNITRLQELLSEIPPEPSRIIMGV